jgi:hypothetical protein
MTDKIREEDLDPKARAFVAIFLQTASELFPTNEGFNKVLQALKFGVQTMEDARAESEAESK